MTDNSNTLFPKLPLSLRHYFPPRWADRYFRGRVFETTEQSPVVEANDDVIS